MNYVKSCFAIYLYSMSLSSISAAPSVGRNNISPSNLRQNVEWELEELWKSSRRASRRRKVDSQRILLGQEPPKLSAKGMEKAPIVFTEDDYAELSGQDTLDPIHSNVEALNWPDQGSQDAFQRNSNYPKTTMTAYVVKTLPRLPLVSELDSKLEADINADFKPLKQVSHPERFSELNLGPTGSVAQPGSNEPLFPLPAAASGRDGVLRSQHLKLQQPRNRPITAGEKSSNSGMQVAIASQTYSTNTDQMASDEPNNDSAIPEFNSGRRSFELGVLKYCWTLALVSIIFFLS